MEYFVEAVDDQGDRHWSDVIRSEGSTASVVEDAREFMLCEMSESFARTLTLRFYRVEENPFASAPSIGFPTDFRLHNWEDVR